jgi:hypothetical protein
MQLEGGLMQRVARIASMAGSLALLAIALPAAAEVKSAKPDGFLIEQRIIVKAGIDTSYQALFEPKYWWSKAHTYGGSSEGLSIERRAGGCFCEKWPGGGAEHARVIYLRDGDTLRLQGAFGPMQSMAVNAVIEFKLTQGKDGTQIDMSYRASGGSDSMLDKIAAPADGMLAEQMAG